MLVPGLVLYCGREQRVAHATSLAAVALLTVAPLARFAVAGQVNWRAGALLLLGAGWGAVLGAALLPHVPIRPLRAAFVVLLVIVAWRLMAPVGPTGGLIQRGWVDSPGRLAIALVLAGLVTGTLSATLGVGGGVILVPLLAEGFGLGQHLAAGTALLVVGPSAMLGALGHTRHHYADWPLAARMAVAGAIVAGFSAHLALGAQATTLRRGLALLLALVAVRLALLGPRLQRPPHP